MNLRPFRSVLLDTFTDAPVFMFHMPETEKSAVLLLHNLNGAKRDSSLPGYKKGKFQAIVRNAKFETGYDMAVKIIQSFEKIKRFTRDSVYIDFVEPLHDPVAFPVSQGNFIEFSVNFLAVYVEDQ